MTPVETAPPATGLGDLVRSKLEEAPAPLTLKDIAKGFPNPQKLKPPAALAEVQKHLDEDVSQGRVFGYPSGKKGEVRYWTKDEKHLLREKALELGATPQAVKV